MKYFSYTLQTYPNLDINRVNFQGLTALTIAVKGQHYDMIELLMAQDGIKMCDAILHAVQEGNVRIVEILLDWQKQ